jgi:uncharacterized protein YbjT (DUF2867 family)
MSLDSIPTRKASANGAAPHHAFHAWRVATSCGTPVTIVLILAAAFGLALAVLVIRAAVKIKQRNLRREWLARRKNLEKAAMSAIKRIAIIGATGMLGIPVTRALLDAGFEVTALARNPQAAESVLPAATNIVAADARDEASLRRGLAGYDGLYLNLSVSPNERRTDFHTEQQGLEHIITAAREAGIKRLAYLSAMIQDTLTSTWWVLDIWREALVRIKKSGIPYTIFYPSNFMETLPQRHMVGAVLVIPGRSPYPNYWIAGRDFGRQVAKSFALPSAANREYVVQGPEPMTYSEAARRFARAAAARPLVVRLPLSILRLAGLVSPEMRFNANMMETVLSYPEVFKAEEAWRELGQPTTTFEEFARSL